MTTSRFLTSASVPTIRATETNRMMSCEMARAGARRVTNVMPMPESINTMGRMAGSAPGAKMRTAICAAAKAAKRPIGTASVSKEITAPAVRTYIAYSKMTGNAEAMSKSSSVLRRLISGTPFLILIGGFGLGGLFGGFLGI
jgi:hypothetical protein